MALISLKLPVKPTLNKEIIIIFIKALQKEVTFAEQDEGQLNAKRFAEFVRAQLPTLFERSSNARGKLFLQDGDPSQNSPKEQEAMCQVRAWKFSMPACSPDLNPVENVFHNVKSQLQDDALNKKITHETCSQFCERVQKTLLSYPPEINDRTTQSMNRRVETIIERKGLRIKY